tara:strand:+ start:3859 stop:5529 length:1671 start_codon:yes stop_codon:yes gene_type:complete
MAGAANVLIKIGAQTADAVNEIGKVNKALGAQMTAGQKAANAIKKAAVPAGIALAAMGAAAYAAVQKAGDLAETQSKVGVIFGESAKELDKWSKNAPKALGQTQQAALDAAATMATFGKAAGLTGGDLVEFSTSLTGLSSDLASFYNTDPADAAAAVGAALRGESEPIRKYGILLNDATLKAEALKLGLIKTTKEALTPQTKALAAQAAILKQSTDAQGDFARTADGAANQQRILKAQIQQLQTELGTALLPAFQAIVSQLGKFASIASENQKVIKVLAVVITGLAVAVIGANVAMKAWQAIMVIIRAATVAYTAVQWALNIALTANPIGLIVLAIAALVTGVIIAYRNSETFRAIVDKLFEAIKTGTRTALQFFIDKWAAISSGIQFLWDLLKRFWPILLPGGVFWLAIKSIENRFGIFGTVVDAVKNAFNFLTTSIDKVKTAVGDLWEKAQIAFKALKNGIGIYLTPLRIAFDAIYNVVKSIVDLIGKIRLPSINIPGIGRIGAGSTSFNGTSAFGAQTIVNVTINGPVDSDATAREILKVLNQYDRRYNLVGA